MVTWTRLIRFVSATDGKTYNGEPIVNGAEVDVAKLFKAGSLQARIITGDDIFSDDAKIADEAVDVKELLGPLTEEQVPIIRCVGLNYMKHSESSACRQKREPSLTMNSPGSRPHTTAVPQHLHQAVDVRRRLGRRNSNPEARTGRPMRLRRRVDHRDRQRRQKHPRGPRA